MMKHVSTLSALFALFLLAGCAPKIVGTGTVITKPRTVLAFQKVKVSDQLTVNFVQAQEGGVEITADDNLHPYIRTSVKKGVLSLSLEETIKSFTKLQVTVKAPKLQQIEAAGTAQLKSPGWKQDGLQLIIKEDCQARLPIEGKSLQVTAMGEARFDGKGKIDQLSLKASDKAQLNFSRYDTKTADVEAGDKSVVTVKANKILNVTASGNAEVIKKGGAQIKRTEISGAATISTP
ncbi:MAG: head GIN domain-containing protein [Schleiferiaceae bacterium]|nr:head GIN domain-containing protein [Schleiferiaceae bacterium]MDR9441801.1 head GIN domain-containing protein [Schleiferiaceae bacterium]